MFKEMFNERRGGRHHHRTDSHRHCFQQAESREEALEMLYEQWREAMRHHAENPRGRHHCSAHHGGRSDGHRGSRGGRDDAGHRDRPSFLRGRKFGADELQLLLLTLLKEQASYGYELIKILSEKSGGFYTPSPGVIYPALTYLEDVGHVTVQPEGNRKRFAINAEGEAYLAQNQEVAQALMAKLALFASQSDSVNQAMSEHRQAFAPVLMEAIHSLRSELHQFHNSDEESQGKAAKIIQQALAQLRDLKE
ncbi:PadR family transcriptional regulator [Erwinia sp. P7711]|uniref:PadR family transcriptional regulator n=1 Tax=Erwinia sp. P7711 TaxID=3141451 RepID=UPI003192EC0F